MTKFCAYIFAETCETQAKCSSPMKPFVIVNPNAGSVKKMDVVRMHLERLRPAAVRMARRSREAERLTRLALRRGERFIVAAGGDGTLNAIANGIGSRARKVSLGLLPLGTGNDFARVLGLPATIEENIEVLRSWKTRRIDLVRARSNRTRYFVNVSAGGFSGLVDEKLTAKIKKNWGPLSYLRSAAAALPQLHAYHTRVVIDGQEELATELYNVVIANGRFVAGGLPIAPNADPSDGSLDLILIPKRTMAETALLAAEILLGKHLSNKAVIYRRAKKIFVRSRPGMWFNVDGELVGNAPVVFQIIAAALNFVVP